MNKQILFSLTLLATLLLSSCRKEFVIPRASGRPYEVMVVMTDKDHQEKDRLAERCAPDRWEVVPYETAEVSGAMLAAFMETWPEPVPP